MPIRSLMSSIKGKIKPEHLELFALEFGKIAESDFVSPSIYKCRPMNTKHGHNIYDNEILDELIMGQISNIWSYLALNMEKLFDFFHIQASTNNNQSAPNLVKMYLTIRS